MTDLRVTLAERFTSAKRSDFLGTLLRLARANEVSTAERDRLHPVATWIGAGDDDLIEALKKADDSDLPLSELVGAFESLEERFLLFREGCAVVWVDGRRSHEELQLLDTLVELLDIDDDARAIMDSPLACSPEGERRFLELLSLTHGASSLKD